MSRTYNTMPWRVQCERVRHIGQSWRLIGYPALIGGCWKQRHELAHESEVMFRQRVRQALYHERELPVLKHDVRWRAW